MTPLHFAVKNNHKETALLLIKKGAEINSVERLNRWTPLHRAVYYNRVEMSLLLIENGADKESKDYV